LNKIYQMYITPRFPATISCTRVRQTGNKKLCFFSFLRYFKLIGNSKAMLMLNHRNVWKERALQNCT
jgi:hypothetical protein